MTNEINSIITPKISPINSGIPSNLISEMPESMLKDGKILKDSIITGVVQNSRNPQNEFIIATEFGDLKLKTSLKLDAGISISLRMISENPKNIQFELISLKKPDETHNLITGHNFIIFTFSKNLTQTIIKEQPVEEIFIQENMQRAILSSFALEINEEGVKSFIHEANAQERNLQDIFIGANLKGKIEEKYLTEFFIQKMRENSLVNFRILPSTDSEKSIPSTVIGHQDKFMIIKNDLGLFRVNDEHKQFVKGLKINLELISIIPQRMDSLKKTEFESITELMQNWRALESAIRTLEKFHPEKSEALIRSIIPSFSDIPNLEEEFTDEISQKLANFIFHLKKSDLKNWMGKEILHHFEKISQETDQKNIIKNLEDDFKLLNKLFFESKFESNVQKSNGWHSLFFPVTNSAGHLEQIAFYVRHFSDFQENEFENQETKNSRFIIEFDNAQTGAMQLDGMVMMQNKTTIFNLTIRTKNPIPQMMKEGINEIFLRSQEVSSMSGVLNFQIQQEFPLSPINEILEEQERTSIFA